MKEWSDEVIVDWRISFYSSDLLLNITLLLTGTTMELLNELSRAGKIHLSNTTDNRGDPIVEELDLLFLFWIFWVFWKNFKYFFRIVIG